MKKNCKKMNGGKDKINKISNKLENTMSLLFIWLYLKHNVRYLF